MIRKHTRRAAKAAFAVSFGVAIILGLFAGTARPAPNAGADDRDRRRRTFPRSTSSASCTSRRSRRRASTSTDKGSLGSTELIHTALTSGKINFYPEYTGVIVEVVHHKTSPKTAAATYALAKQLEAKSGLTLLNATPFYDTDVIAVTNATAKKYGLKSVADLKKVGSFKFGGFPECKTRTTCFLGLTNTYGVTNASFVPLGGHLGVRGARRRHGAGGRRLLDRPAARQGLEVHGARRPEAHRRLPERRADRQGVGRRRRPARSSRRRSTRSRRC